MNDDLHDPEADALGQTFAAKSRAAAGSLKQTLQSHNRLVSPLKRCVLISAIVLVLLIPLGYVQDLVHEREFLHHKATDNIAGSWGRAQTVSGPALIIPYEVWRDRKEVVTVRVDGKDKEQEVVTREYIVRHKVVLPADVRFEATLDPEVRYRGIYRQALYSAPVRAQGSFRLPGTGDFSSTMHRIHWDKSYLAVGITDLKAIADEKPARWNGVAAAPYQPGTDAGDLLGPGFHANLPMTDSDAGTKREFAIELQIRGSGGIAFTPVGEKTVIAITGSWPAPSFQGNLLPVERSITEQGFSAQWIIPNLTRTYPQIGDLGEYTNGSKARNSDSLITSFTAGVDLHETVSLYRMILRAANYGLLFIAGMFVALFAFEMTIRQRLHPLQYGMVGLSMSLFYLVLLSLAEHIGFGSAFVAAGAVTVGMNSLYVASALHSRRYGVYLGLVLSGLYGVLFSLLRMEDFALLVGTGLVVMMMGVLMVVTRKLPQHNPGQTAMK